MDEEPRGWRTIDPEEVGSDEALYRLYRSGGDRFGQADRTIAYPGRAGTETRIPECLVHFHDREEEVEGPTGAGRRYSGSLGDGSSLVYREGHARQVSRGGQDHL